MRGPPSPESGGTEAGANHARALGALMNLAEPEDATLIASALEQTCTSDLRLAAAYAGSTALERSTSPDERLVAALEQLAFDEAAELDERRAAVSALGCTRCAAATNALLRITRLADLGLQARAALHLLTSDRRVHRARVEEIVRTWPDKPPYPADEVLELLAEVD